VPSVAHLLDLSLLMGNHRGLLVFAVLRWLWQAGSRWATTTRQFTSVAQYLVVAKSKSEDQRAELAELQKAVERLRQKFVEQLKEAERLRQLADEIARKSQEQAKATLD
jgi:cell shape-determining protein MreC